MHFWTDTDARPGLPRVVRAAINVANSFKISTYSWLLWGPPSRAWLSLPNGFLCISIPAVTTRLSTTHQRPISLIHFPSLMSVLICWAIVRMIASSFHWMRGIFFRSIFFRLGLFCSASWVSRPRVLIAQQLLIECARYQRMLFFTCSYPIHCLILLD